MGRRQQTRSNMQNKLAAVKEVPEEPVSMTRNISAQSCPAHINKSKACVEEFANAAQETPQLEKCISAPAVVSAVPHWPGVSGADIKVRNTFLHVEMEEGDEELEFLQACRRRDTHSCPLFSSCKEPAPEESPQMPMGTTDTNDFLAEPAMEPSPEQPVNRNAPFEDAAWAETSLHNGAQEPFGKLMAWAVGTHHSAPGRQAGADVADGSISAATISALHPYQGLTEDPSFEGPSESSLLAHSTFGYDQYHPYHGLTKDPSFEGPSESPLLAHSNYEPELEPESISRGGSRRNRANRRGVRLWCHIFIDPCMLEPGFGLVKKLIGKGGCNTRGIYESTWTKIRIRGKGSAHVEEKTGREAPVPLMVALAAENGDSFSKAFEMTKDLLEDVSKRFETFCQRQGWPAPKGPLFSLGESSKQSLACLSQAALDGVHMRMSRQTW